MPARHPEDEATRRHRDTGWRARETSRSPILPAARAAVAAAPAPSLVSIAGCATGSVAGTLAFSRVTRSGAAAQSAVAVSSTQTAGTTGLAFAGTVTSGLFAGDDYTLTFVVNPLQLLQCFSAQGVTGVSVSAVGVFSRPLPSR